MDKVIVPGDPLSPSHLTTLAPQVEEGEVENPPVDLSPSSPTPPAQDLCTDLECNPDGCHVVLSPQPLSFGPFNPSNFGVFSSSISDLTCDVHKDQVLDGVSAEQPTCGIIFYDYVWEYEQEYVVKDDLLLFTPHPLYPDIFHNSTISDPSCENSFSDVSIFDHSQNIWDANFSFDCGEDKFIFSYPPNLLSYFSGNIEGEISHFSSSPIYDSSDHEDVIVHHLEFFYRGL